jgi:hypothetical protein
MMIAACNLREVLCGIKRFSKKRTYSSRMA